VVLMVHGAVNPSTPVFDLSYKDYSWMGSLAEAGFDVFAMDLVGYGGSTRPWPMDDPCNASPELQTALFSPYPLETPCPPSYPFLLTNAQSELDEIDQVVEYLRSIRQVERIHLIGYSSGGARFGRYAALHPEKVDKLILLAPAYDADVPTNPPAEIPGRGFSLQAIRSDLPIGRVLPLPAHCGAATESELRPVLRAANAEFDPIGATWGPGVTRAPTSQQGWGWNATRAAQVQAPTLVLSGEFDSVRPQAIVRQLYNDLGPEQKVFVDLACSEHTVPLETRHNIVKETSLEWLLQGSVHGLESGTLRLGD
jgi:pimeloyl-ACP methyl ester carboxylesterase